MYTLFSNVEPENLEFWNIDASDFLYSTSTQLSLNSNASGWSLLRPYALKSIKWKTVSLSRQTIFHDYKRKVRISKIKTQWSSQRPTASLNNILF